MASRPRVPGAARPLVERAGGPDEVWGMIAGYVAMARPADLAIGDELR